MATRLDEDQIKELMVELLELHCQDTTGVHKRPFYLD